MSKAYSNKALPPGTVIREWRLEDVLGVGGFGIVYKGRGIYFGELVAIKEYFPSSIAERDAEDTVVPIGSDVEEVHALGLKKFVEEAKLLWNLSTPTRHPNIVSVRSLFEVHGTAYMVMDFEDGVSLSKLLREGRRFNERSLWNIIKPIADGLDRAHRVGVLHRDIKPPNILITDDNRPVLIDFGSARFEAAEATSTSVTFHTPPYAALEQYVKTYPQGPWTDVYALAVVLHECVTGEKPPEVLERLHGGMGKPLAEGHWPGFGKRFLQAIDAGMTIRPTERPQSIREWLALFGKKDSEAPTPGEDEPTRFFSHEVAAEEIVPVPPPAPGFEKGKTPDSRIPADPKEVQFKRAGEETKTSTKKAKTKAEARAAKEELAEVDEDAAQPAAEKATPPAIKPKEGSAERSRGFGAVDKWLKRQRTATLAGIGAVAVLASAGAGYFLLGSGESNEAEPIEIPDLTSSDSGSIPLEGLGQLAAAEQALAEEARTAGAAATAINELTLANERLASQLAELQALSNDPSQTAVASGRVDEMKRTATSANVAFGNALLRDAEARSRSLPASGRPAALDAALSGLRTAVTALGSLTDPVQSLGGARDALAKSQLFAAALQAANRAQAASRVSTEPSRPATGSAAVNGSTSRQAPVPVAVSGSDAPAATQPSEGVSQSKRAQLNSIVTSGRSMARQVIRMGDGGSAAQKENAKLARNYDKYLANVADSARGANSDREFDELIGKANQTKAYIVFLHRQSSAAN